MTCKAFYSGKIADAHQFESIHHRLKNAFDFLRRPDLFSLAAGRYEIDGDNCWAMVQDANLTPWGGSKQRVEVHKKYIDVQAPLDGPETYGLTEVNDAFEPFDNERDIAFADREAIPLTLAPGSFAVFMPRIGAHAPCRALDGSKRRRKLVIKVLF